MVQVKSLSLGDGTTKIFLNADSQLDDVSRELRAFLDYIAGKKPDDAFAEKLEEAGRKARKNREWRHEYMTLLMRDQENIEKGIEKGKIYGAISMCRDLVLSDDEKCSILRKDLKSRKEIRYGICKYDLR